MRLSRPLGLVALLAACDAVPPVAPGTPMIVVASGGSMFGSHAITIYADGTVVSDSAVVGTKPLHSVRKGARAAYTAAAAVVATEGPRTKAALKTDTAFCTDYGMDQVRADPPIGGFDQVSSACPNDTVTALMDHVLAAVAAP